MILIVDGDGGGCRTLGSTLRVFSFDGDGGSCKLLGSTYWECTVKGDGGDAKLLGSTVLFLIADGDGGDLLRRSGDSGHFVDGDLVGMVEVLELRERRELRFLRRGEALISGGTRSAGRGRASSE